MYLLPMTNTIYFTLLITFNYVSLTHTDYMSVFIDCRVLSGRISTLIDRIITHSSHFKSELQFLHWKLETRYLILNSMATCSCWENDRLEAVVLLNAIQIKSMNLFHAVHVGFTINKYARWTLKIHKPNQTTTAKRNVGLNTRSMKSYFQADTCFVTRRQNSRTSVFWKFCILTSPLKKTEQKCTSLPQLIALVILRDCIECFGVWLGVNDLFLNKVVNDIDSKCSNWFYNENSYSLQMNIPNQSRDFV